MLLSGSKLPKKIFVAWQATLSKGETTFMILPSLMVSKKGAGFPTFQCILVTVALVEQLLTTQSQRQRPIIGSNSTTACSRDVFQRFETWTPFSKFICGATACWKPTVWPCLAVHSSQSVLFRTKFLEAILRKIVQFFFLALNNPRVSSYRRAAFEKQRTFELNFT